MTWKESSASGLTWSLVVAGSCALSWHGTLLARTGSPRAPISLVLVVVVDQLRADYLARFAPQLNGGLHRLLVTGAVDLHGEQAHAVSETAPGHATILSGREPASTGIVSNSRGVPDASSPVLGADDSVGASPRRFRGTTLVDWLLRRDPSTRVLSVSRKDRGAILPIGRAKVPVFWYAGGAFTTSRYYADTLPEWVRAYNARLDAGRFAGAAWVPLLPESAYPEPDTVDFENGGRDVAFPHRLPPDRKTAPLRLVAYPWMDSLTLGLALAGAHALGLGARPRPDLLSISLSTTDAVGHAFGPDSREIHDQVLRLDRWLGDFLDSLSTLVPAERTLVVLTADHGVQSLPEYTRIVRHRAGGRVWLGDLAATGIAGMRFESGLLSADTAELRRHGLDPDSLAAVFAREASTRPGVQRVFTPRSLVRAPARDREAFLWRRLLPPGYGWLLCASLVPGYVWSSAGNEAEHGSTAEEDLEVPIAFAGPGISARTLQRRVRTVDIAPTLAAMLGVSPAERVDGVVLTEVTAAAHDPAVRSPSVPGGRKP